MDIRQQRRLLWILGKLTPDMEEQVGHLFGWHADCSLRSLPDFVSPSCWQIDMQIAGDVWWGGRGWTLPVVVGSHGSWNWEAGGWIWGHILKLLRILESWWCCMIRDLRLFDWLVNCNWLNPSIAFWSNSWGPAIWWVWCYVDFRWSWWGHLAMLMLLSNHCQKSPKSWFHATNV